MYLRNNVLRKTWLDKWLESAVSEDTSRSKMVSGPKHCWILHDSTFIIVIDHFEGNWVEKVGISDM